MPRTAKVVDGVVDVISLTREADDEWIEVPENVYAGGLQQADGTFTAPPFVATNEDVDAERDRRVAAGFEFEGVRYQFRPEDRQNIGDMSIAALEAITREAAQPGDLTWAYGVDHDFAWIAEDNTQTPMCAHKMMSFAKAAKTHFASHVHAARALKDMVPIPAEFADDSHWP